MASPPSLRNSIIANFFITKCMAVVVITNITNQQKIFSFRTITFIANSGLLIHWLCSRNSIFFLLNGKSFFNIIFLIYFLLSSTNISYWLFFSNSSIKIAFKDLSKISSAHWALIGYFRPIQYALMTKAMVAIYFSKEEIFWLI